MPIPIHMTFKLNGGYYAVHCKTIEQARELRDRAAYNSKLSYPRINKSGRLHKKAKRITAKLFVKLY